MRAPSSDLPLVLDHVSLSAGITTILDRLNLTIASGAPTFIIGPNGAGKTTPAAALHGTRDAHDRSHQLGQAAPRAPVRAARSCFSVR